MTNYNERLDRILNWQQRMIVVEALNQDISDTHKLEITGDIMNKYRAEAKQAITSLIKELVAEAKPAEKDQLAQSTLDDESRCRFYRYGGYNFALNEFEQNLLKALEEV